MPEEQFSGVAGNIDYDLPLVAIFFFFFLHCG